MKQITTVLSSQFNKEETELLDSMCKCIRSLSVEQQLVAMMYITNDGIPKLSTTLNFLINSLASTLANNSNKETLKQCLEGVMEIYVEHTREQ